MGAESTEGEVEIVNDLGLHTRAATILVKTARRFSSEIELSLEDMKANAKSIMGLLALGARKGSRLKLATRGADHEMAFRAVRMLIENGFHEEIT